MNQRNLKIVLEYLLDSEGSSFEQDVLEGITLIRTLNYSKEQVEALLEQLYSLGYENKHIYFNVLCLALEYVTKYPSNYLVES